MINPYMLIEPRNNVNIIYKQPDGSPYIAFCSKTGVGRDKYKIFVNTDFFTKMEQKYGTVVSVIMQTATLLREIAHINENSFLAIGMDKQAVGTDTKVISLIYNILEDMRVEYYMQLKYHTTSNYFNIMLNILDKERKNSDELGEFEKYMNSLFNFIRHKQIDNSMLEFMTFLLPIENRLKFADCHETYQLAMMINSYIAYKMNPMPPNNQDAISYEEKYNTRKIDTDNIEDKDVESIQEEITQIINEGKQDENMVSVEAKKLIDEVNDNKDTIIDISSVFRIMFESIKITEVLEGEIDINKQQQAYIDSIIGDEGRNYLDIRKEYDVSFDFVLLRDVSGSIQPYKKSYYSAALSILSSLERFNNISTACIRFDTEAVLEKDFITRLLDSNVANVDGGGTNMLEALKYLSKLNYKHANKFIVVLTDGYTCNEKQCYEKLTELRQNTDNLVIVLHVGKTQPSVLVDAVTTFEKLSETLYDMIVEYINRIKVNIRYER